MMYKFIRCVSVIIIVTTVIFFHHSASAQLSSDFELGSRNDYVAQCWTFSGFSVSSAGTPISGSFHARSQNHNISITEPREVGLPYMEWSGAHIITFTHKKDQTTNIRLEVVVADKDGNETNVFTRDGYARNVEYTETINVNLTGVYRLYLRTYYPGGGNVNVRTMFDDLSITGVLDVSDKNALGFAPYNSTFVTCPCVQEAPVVVDDVVDVDEDNALQISAFANDTDSDGDLDNTSVIILTAPTNGTASVDPATGIITYTPNANYFGPDAIEYEISDMYPFGPVNSDQGNIIITVNPVNDPPTTADIAVSTDEDVSYTFDPADLVFTDIDGVFQAFQLTGALTNAIGALEYDGVAVTLNTDYNDFSKLVFIPNPGESGVTDFPFVVKDDGGAISIPATITVTVNEVNGPPTSSDFGVSLTSTDEYIFSLSQLIYVDPDSDPFGGFTIQGFTGMGQLLYDGMPISPGMLLLEFDKLSYIPESGETEVRITFTVEDDQGVESITYTITIIISSQSQELRISEGFSPNSDGINDFWYIQGISTYPNNEVQIFNRWGNLVRSIEGYDNEGKAWRGESDQSGWGDALPDGSYFFTLNLGDGSPALQGYIVLSR